MGKLKRMRTPLIVLATGVTALLSVAPGSAQAAFPGENGKIVFARQSGAGTVGTTNWYLFSKNPDGSETQLTGLGGPNGEGQLTNGSTAPNSQIHMDGWPSFSPDGRRIVFQRKGSQNGVYHSYELYMLTLNDDGSVNADGSSETRLTTNEVGQERTVSFSPDGKKIVFEAKGGSLENQGCWDLYTMDLNDGGDPSKWNRISRSCAARTASEWPAWSPDGSKIAFQRSVDGGSAIFTVKPDGTDEKRVTPISTYATAPTFSPDGTKIAYTAGGGIWTIDADGSSETTRLSNSKRGDDWAAFSPDGKQVAFQRVRDTSCYTAGLYETCVDNIFTMNVADDASGQTNGTNSLLSERHADWGIAPGSALKPAISVGNASVTEGNKGQRQATFTVSLSRPFFDPVAVDYRTADGSATAAGKLADYTATSGTLTFAAGETSKTVAVPVTGDSRLEPDESFYLELSSPSGATLGESRGAGTIVNDDGKK